MTAPRSIPQAKSAQPVISTGTGVAGIVTSALVRPASQGLTPLALLEAVEAFELWHPTPAQYKSALVLGGIAFSAAQNLVEYMKGRRLIGVRAD